MRPVVLGFVATALLGACDLNTPSSTAPTHPAATLAPPVAAASTPPPAIDTEPAALNVGSKWNFALESKGAAALTKGWATPEPWGAWSMAQNATITLEIDPSLDGKTLGLAFVTQGYVNDKVPEQTVSVKSGGVDVGTWTFRSPLQLAIPQKLTIPATARAAGTQLVLEFALPNAVSPKKLGESDDERQLALGVVSVSVASAL